MNNCYDGCRSWSHKVLPLVYDDSLSYYEQLCKLFHKFNELAEFVGNIIPTDGKCDIINVKDCGATGNKEEDCTDSVKLAISLGNIIYFPPGVYRFKRVDIDKPVVILGCDATLTPIHKTPTSNQSYSMFRVNGVPVTFYGLRFRGDNSVVEQSGTKYQTEACLQFLSCPEVNIFKCVVENFFETYHMSVKDVMFEYREGMFLYARDCDVINFNYNSVHDFGGQELTIIGNVASGFSAGAYTFAGNNFIDRNSGATGSALNVMGGNIVFRDNYGKNFNNIYEDDEGAGSVFNLFGANVFIMDNCFSDCVGGSLFDTCEGYYFKNTRMVAMNNILTGVFTTGFKVNSVYATIVGNKIDALSPFKCFTMNADFGYDTRCESADLLYKHENINIKNNVFNMTFKEGYTKAYHGIHIGQSRDEDGSRASFNMIDVSGNTITADSAEVGSPIWIESPSKVVIINNNNFGCCGIAPITTARKNFIAYTDATPFELFVVSYNTFKPLNAVETDAINAIIVKTDETSAGTLDCVANVAHLLKEGASRIWLGGGDVVPVSEANVGFV